MARLSAVSAVAVLTLLACLYGASGRALGADAKVAIGDYRWTPDEVDIDLHQYVTWYWVGPDTMHSVTGMSVNDLGIDSDPGTSVPMHRVGSTFRVTFNQPGVYYFQCKMHPIVHGWVHVSDTPGNPADNPDPTPHPALVQQRPHLSAVRLAPSPFGAVQGTTIHYTLDLRATLDAEIWHRGAHGRRGRYAGWRRWRGHIGFNQGPLGAGAHFRPRPGRYIAFLQATTPGFVESNTARLRFTIRGPPRHVTRRRRRR